jgi:hypothetical protein
MALARTAISRLDDAGAAGKVLKTCSIEHVYQAMSI